MRFSISFSRSVFLLATAYRRIEETSAKGGFDFEAGRIGRKGYRLLLSRRQRLSDGSDWGAVEEKLGPLAFGWFEGVFGNGAADRVLEYGLELPQVLALLRRSPHAWRHQRCFAVPLGMSCYGNRTISTHRGLVAHASDLDILLHYQN